MIYVNLTGKHIGECLTGFGIHYPVTIINSGNSDMLYTFDITNTDIFSFSQNDLIINNGSSGVIDVFYLPTITNSTATDNADFYIATQSVEDGSTDPSGKIKIEITGSRIITTTPGHVRKFIALKNYDSAKGVNYDFSWLPPTGTGNYFNYFLTGYRLDISTGSNFDALDIVYQTTLNIAQNTNNNPKYASYYGFDEIEIKKNVSKIDFPAITLDQPYFARVFAESCGISGISIYATGVDSLNQQLSTDVIDGNSGVRPDIQFAKKMLDVYIEQGNFINYKLNKKIISANNDSPDLLFYSGINIYFSSNSTFESSDENNYAVDFEKAIFLNFSGNMPNGTNINFYVPDTTRFFGNFGKGGDNIAIQFNPTPRSYNISLPDLNYIYAESTGLTDAKVGGNVLNLNAQTFVNNSTRTDIIYNIYSQKNSSFLAGGGGNKAGLFIYLSNGSSLGVGTDNIKRTNVYPINGSFNKLGINTNFNIYKGVNAVLYNSSSILPQSNIVANVYSPKQAFGENGINTVVLNMIKSDGMNKTGSYKIDNIWNNTYLSVATNVVQPAAFKPINNVAAPSCGNLINKFANSTVKLNIYNENIINDYAFRFKDPSSSSSWTGYDGASTPNSIITLNSTVGTPSYQSNFKSFGYKAIKLENASLSGNFGSTIINCPNFDLFFVCCIETNGNTAYLSKFFDWFLTSFDSNVTSKHINFRNFAVGTYNAYEKESNIFNFFLSPLYNSTINNSNSFFVANPTAEQSFYQISKPIYTLTDYYPFILNIQRVDKTYILSINGELHSIYTLPQSTAYLSTTNNTTFKLVNDQASNFSTNYFDIAFYNRVLFDDERVQIYNYFLKTYLKLFTGETNTSLLIDDRIRLPNIFNIAGKISTQIS